MNNLKAIYEGMDDNERFGLSLGITSTMQLDKEWHFPALFSP